MAAYKGVCVGGPRDGMVDAYGTETVAIPEPVDDDATFEPGFVRRYHLYEWREDHFEYLGLGL